VTFPYYPPTVEFIPEPQTGWICPACQRGIAPFMPHCPFCAVKPPKAGGTTNFTSGCPRCGKKEAGVCSAGDCPNYGTRC
jgi:hypothetical protein